MSDCVDRVIGEFLKTPSLIPETTIPRKVIVNQHEWRFIKTAKFGYGQSSWYERVFYCIHCREVVNEKT